MGQKVSHTRITDWRKRLMSEYQIKLEAIREYEDALRLKKTYEEAVEVNSGLLREIVNYCEKQGLGIPSEVRGFMMKLVGIVQATSPEVKHFFESPDDEAESRPSQTSL